MYQAMALELSGPQRRDLLEAKARLQEPIFTRLRAHSQAGELTSRPPAHLYSPLLGAAHDACRHHLTGTEADPAWMRAMLPGAAWRCTSSMDQARRAPTESACSSNTSAAARAWRP